MTDTPRRIQLSRAKGWRMPPNTVKVDRSTLWGNRWRAIHHCGRFFCDDTGGSFMIEAHDHAAAIALALEHYRAWVEPHADAIRAELRGKNLACWCRLEWPCHADILLEIAND